MQPHITNFRKVDINGVKAFFDVTIYDGDDAVFVLRSIGLRQSAAGKWWISPPSKQRMDKNTKQPATDKDGKAIYDKHFDVALEKTAEGYRPTKAGGRFQNEIIRLALAALGEELTADAGRGGQKTQSRKLPF